MKNFIKTVGLAIVAVLMLAGSVMATTITYSDNTINFPGYDYLGYTNDVIGTPSVSSLSVTYDAQMFLESIVVNMTGRRTWDSLFINTGGTGNWDSWDYYVRDNNLDNSGGASLYTVNTNYTYIYVNDVNARNGHPAGIVLSDLNLIGPISVQWDSVGGMLTYTFVPGTIQLYGGYTIGYSPWCANDVILTPEPGILMLLGFGILGLAGFRRRVKK